MSVDTHMNISPVIGTNANDWLTGTGRSEVIYGAGGEDKIYGLSGHDEIFGGGGDDRIYGQGGDDIIYGNGRPSYIDMSNLIMVENATATVTFVDEGAGYRNALGVYEIDGNGAFGNVQILFPNASAQGSGGDLIRNESQVSFDVNEGSKLGFFVVSNGYGKGSQNREALESQSGQFQLRDGDGALGTISGGPVTLWHVDTDGSEAQVQSQYGFDIYHSAADPENDYALNADNYVHVVGRASAVSGDLLVGFEDLRNGGDNDYDDTVIQVNLGQNNIVAQLPVSKGNGPYESDDDVLYGGIGDDIIYGNRGDDIIVGGSGNDELNGNSGSDSLHGSSGNDILEGHSGNDFLSGGGNEDTLKGGSGNDRLMGDSGADTLFGGSGIDFLYGGSGNDIIFGNSDDDVLYGENGADTLNGNSGDDRIFGGNGNDILNGHSGHDHLEGGSGQDRLVGGGGDDILSGGLHNDKLYGSSGNDELWGEVGNDYLTGGSGNDLIVGGVGSDKLFGGSGDDTFMFAEFSAGDRDIVADYTTGDALDWSWFEFETVDAIRDSATQVGSNVVIDFDQDFEVRFNNVELAFLNFDDFII